MIAEIQCVPSPAGTQQRPYAHIEAAIARIGDAGVEVEVGPLGTTIEGTPDQVWAVLRAAHEATLLAGAASTVSVVKVVSNAADDGPHMAELVADYR